MQLKINNKIQDEAPANLVSNEDNTIKEEIRVRTFAEMMFDSKGMRKLKQVLDNQLMWDFGT